MVRWFDDVVEETKAGEKAAVRALQAWQYLINSAANRQIVRYEDLRKLMGYPTSNPLGSILGCIMFFCEQNDLPPLTLLVVNESGEPGGGFTAEQRKNYHRKREEVFDCEWLKMVPPTIDEFSEARKSAP